MGAPGPARVLEISDQLLLLGVDRDRRLTLAQRRTDRLVDVFKLSVAVGMVRSLAGLAVCLKAVAPSTQYPTHAGMTDPMTQFPHTPAHLRQPLNLPPNTLL